MNNDDPEASPLELTIDKMGAALRDRSLGVVDLVKASLDRIAETSDLNAFIDVNADEALRVASAHQVLLDQGYDLGPLHGIPIGVKDNIDRAGRVMTAGSEILRDNVATTDATVVARLRRAGSVLVGTTNLHEFAWGGTTNNPHYGSCRNPWDRTRIPAGSSGGSGVAVAVGATAASLGTDTGGSVRLPASMNGVTGIRPTLGRVSTAGVFPLAWTMDTVGPIARSSDDCALLLQEVAGWDPRDPTTATADPGRFLADIDLPLSGLRVGLVDGYSLHGLQPDVDGAIRDAVATLQRLGALVTELNLPDIDGVVDAQIVVDAAEPSAVHQRWIMDRPDDYGSDVRLLLQAGHAFSAVDYIQAQRYRSALRATFLQRLRHVDVVITPTIPFTAPHLGARSVPTGQGGHADVLVGNMQFTALPSMTGTPAISLPAGFDTNGMPIGLQVIAAPFAESMLFRVGHHFQNATDFHLRHPPAGG